MPPRDFPFWAKSREAQGGHIVISFLFFTFPFLFLTFFTSTSPISFLIDFSVFIFHFSVFVFNVLIFTSLFCFSVEIPVFILKILLFVFVSNLLIFTDLFFFYFSVFVFAFKLYNENQNQNLIINIKQRKPKNRNQLCWRMNMADQGVPPAKCGFVGNVRLSPGKILILPLLITIALNHKPYFFSMTF